MDSPGIAKIYDENGWETGMFYLENGHCEIRESLYPLEDFDMARIFTFRNHRKAHLCMPS